MEQGKKKWIVIGAAVVVVSAAGVALLRFWRNQIDFLSLSMGLLGGKSQTKLEEAPEVAKEGKIFRFEKSATYLDYIADLRKQIISGKPLCKSVLINLRSALKELIRKEFIELYMRNLQSRQPFLEKITEWTEMYANNNAELLNLIAEGEKVVTLDCGVAYDKYLDHHHALQQKDHHYMVTTIKIIEKLKSVPKKRPQEPVDVALLNKIIDYKIVLAKNVPLEPFQSESYRKADHKWHIINELAYYHFKFYDGDVPAQLFEDPVISEKHAHLVKEFLFQTFPGLCMPN